MRAKRFSSRDSHASLDVVGMGGPDRADPRPRHFTLKMQMSGSASTSSSSSWLRSSSSTSSSCRYRLILCERSPSFLPTVLPWAQRDGCIMYKVSCCAMCLVSSFPICPDKCGGGIYRHAGSHILKELPQTRGVFIFICGTSPSWKLKVVHNCYKP